MLLPSHYQILINSFKQFKFLINHDTIKIYIKDKEIMLTTNDIESLTKGLFYPDTPCSYFYLKNNEIDIDFRLCSTTKLISLGKFVEQNVTSQIEESHNGIYSINHSMAINESITNEEMQTLIIKNCLILAYKFMKTKNFIYLGIIIHIIQDSWSQSHTFRKLIDYEPVKIMEQSFININNKLKEIDEIEKNKVEIFESFQNFQKKYEGQKFKYQLPTKLHNINDISSIVYYLISNKEYRDELVEILKNNSLTSDKKTVVFINKILEQLIIIFNNNFSTNSINILKSLIGKADSNLINSKYIIGTQVPYTNLNLKNIDYTKILEQKKNIFDENTAIYEKLPKQIKRLYKLVLNTLNLEIDFENILNIKINKYLQTGGLNNRPYISLFYYYPFENKNYHVGYDCYHIATKITDNKNMNYSIQDTFTSLTILIEAFYLLNKIGNEKNELVIIYYLTLFYNFLVNQVFFISKEDLNKTNKYFDYSSFNVQLKKEMTENKTSLSKCLYENVSLINNNFFISFEKFTDDLFKSYN